MRANKTCGLTLVCAMVILEVLKCGADSSPEKPQRIAGIAPVDTPLTGAPQKMFNYRETLKRAREEISHFKDSVRGGSAPWREEMQLKLLNFLNACEKVCRTCVRQPLIREA